MVLKVESLQNHRIYYLQAYVYVHEHLFDPEMLQAATVKGLREL